MSVDLARMLKRSKKDVAKFIAEMEDQYAYPSHDIRLLDEVGQTVSQKIASLGMDPGDTTSEELYHGLLSKFNHDALLVDAALGVSPNTDFENRLTRAIGITSSALGNCEVWALKHSVAKKLLQDQPPKKLSRLLHYRSVDSMLKREDIGELFLLSALVESKAWQANFSRTVAHLPTTDYSLQSINIVRLPADKIDAAITPPDLNVCNKLTASLAIWPAKSLANAPVVSLALMLTRAIQELGVSVPIKSLLSTHPSLAWWSDTGHLVSTHANKPVSLNIHDVAHNHQNELTHGLGDSKHATKALWDELANRYHSMGDEVSRGIQNEVTNLIPAQLAAEYQEA